MKLQRLTFMLTVINVLLMTLLITGAGTAKVDPKSVAPVLRGRALELVDESGMVRSRINVEADGGVTLRMIDQKGRIRVKLGAGEDGSGLLLADETTEPGIYMIARRHGTRELPNTTSITLQTGDRKWRITPLGASQ